MKKFLLGTLKFLLMIGIGLILGEGLFRLWTPPPRPRHDRPRYLVGDQSMASVRDSRSIHPHQDNIFRIFVLGDSYTWGANNLQVSTYPSVLEWMLNAVTNGGFEVYNYGVNGATTEDELRLMEKIIKHQPDMIIIGYFLNDPDPNRNLPPDLVPLFESEAKPSRLRVWLSAHVRLYAFLHQRMWASRMVRTQIAYFHKLYDPARRTWPRHEKELHRIAEFRRKTGIPVLVVIWPHLGFPMDQRYPFQDIHQQVAKVLTGDNIPVIDLYRYFKGMDNRRLQAVPALDPHPSEIAHRLAAEVIFDWMVKAIPRVATAVNRPRLLPNRPYPSFRLRLAPLRP